MFARHLGRETVAPALVLLVLYEIFMALSPQGACLWEHRRTAASPAPLVAHLGEAHRQLWGFMIALLIGGLGSTDNAPSPQRHGAYQGHSVFAGVVDRR